MSPLLALGSRNCLSGSVRRSVHATVRCAAHTSMPRLGTRIAQRLSRPRYAVPLNEAAGGDGQRAAPG
jgi:hypothetical protein